MRVIDTNVLVYHLLGQSGELSEQSSALFHRLRSGNETAHVPITAIFECIYTCHSSYRVPNDVLAMVLLDILEFPGVVVEHRPALVDGLGVWRTQGPLSLADCYHLALTRELGFGRNLQLRPQDGPLPGCDTHRAVICPRVTVTPPGRAVRESTPGRT